MDQHVLNTLSDIAAGPRTPLILSIGSSVASDIEDVRRAEREALLITFERASLQMQVELQGLIADAQISVTDLECLDAHLLKVFETVSASEAAVDLDEEDTVRTFV